MKTKLYIYLQLNYLLFRTAIEAEILFAVCLSKKQALTGGKSLASKDKCSKKIGAESAVLTLVYFYIIVIVHKCQQSAKRKLLLNSPTDRTFENRHVGCKEREKINRRRTLCTLRINFFEATPQTACIFSKEDEHAQQVYIRYGNGVETRYKYDEKRRWLDTIETKKRTNPRRFPKNKVFI